MKKTCVVMLILFCLTALAGCTGLFSEEPEEEITNMSSADEYTVSPAKASFAVGETVTVSQGGRELYTLTIDSLTLTQVPEGQEAQGQDEQTQNAAVQAPKTVVLMTCTYENLSMDEGLYLAPADLRLIDGDGNVCEVYVQAELKNIARIAPKGEKCTADMAFVTPSTQKAFKVLHYGSLLQKKETAVFEVAAE